MGASVDVCIPPSTGPVGSCVTGLRFLRGVEKTSGKGVRSPKSPSYNRTGGSPKVSGFTERNYRKRGRRRVSVGREENRDGTPNPPPRSLRLSLLSLRGRF